MRRLAGILATNSAAAVFAFPMTGVIEPDESISSITSELPAV